MYRRLRETLDSGPRTPPVGPERSRTMSRIRSSTSIEVIFKMALVRAGIAKWNVPRSRDIPGRPDIYFPLHRIAVFVDGCFWHGCPCCGHIPKTRSDFWREKFRINRERDEHVAQLLEAKNIRVLRVWEHELHDSALLLSAVGRLREAINVCGGVG